VAESAHDTAPTAKNYCASDDKKTRVTTVSCVAESGWQRVHTIQLLQ